MKLTKSLILVLSGVAMMASASCSNNDDSGKSDSTAPQTTSTSEGISNFDVRQSFKSIARNYRVTAPGTNDWLKDAGVQAAVSVQWPEKLGDADIKALQDSIVELVADTTAFGRDIDKAMRAYVDTPAGTEGCTLAAIDSVPTAPMIDNQLTVSFKALTRRLAVVESAFYTYEGGAHGNYGSKFINFDLNTGSALGYDQIFNAGTADAVKDAVYGALMEKYNVSKVADLDGRGIFSASLFVTHNVWIDGDEIVFYYNVYEIAPYSAGPVEVRVPAYKVDTLLTPAAKSILLGV